jgi:hypothetical protein
MNLIEEFERLDKLIIERSPEIFNMRGILHSMREQVEAQFKALEEHAALKVAHERLQAENAKLKQPSGAAWGSRPRVPGRLG